MDSFSPLSSSFFIAPNPHRRAHVKSSRQDNARIGYYCVDATVSYAPCAVNYQLERLCSGQCYSVYSLLVVVVVVVTSAFVVIHQGSSSSSPAAINHVPTNQIAVRRRSQLVSLPASLPASFRYRALPAWSLEVTARVGPIPMPLSCRTAVSPLLLAVGRVSQVGCCADGYSAGAVADLSVPRP